MRLSHTLPLSLVLASACGCAGFDTLRAPPPAQHNENAAEDRDTVAAVFMAGTFQSMQHLAQAGPAEQAEIVTAAREACDRAPQQTSAKLRYALLLATPGHPARNPVLAQKLLRELAAQPESLQPPERAVALVELAQINGEIELQPKMIVYCRPPICAQNASATPPRYTVCRLKWTRMPSFASRSRTPRPSSTRSPISSAT